MLQKLNNPTSWVVLLASLAHLEDVMAINGYQLSQSQSMDTGSRTKQPDDNREAMLKHEETREEALYGTLELLKESNMALAEPEDLRLLRSAGGRPKYVDNIRKKHSKTMFNLKDSLIMGAFKKRV